MTEWTVDLAAHRALHTSGLYLSFEGEPDTDHFTGSPGNYSKAMNPIMLSRLIREGFAAYQIAWKEALRSDDGCIVMRHKLGRHRPTSLPR